MKYTFENISLVLSSSDSKTPACNAPPPILVIESLAIKRSFPRAKAICIKPDAKAPEPYFRSTGSRYNSGKSQSPLGSFARISIVPYLKVNVSLVRSRHDTTGGRIREY